MKNIFKTLVVSVMSVLTLTGCSSSIAYTYSIETGDKVVIELDTSDGHKLSSDVPFEVSLDGEVLTTGTFIPGSSYDDYVYSVQDTEDAVLVDQGERDGLEYIFYSYGKAEYNYIINIKGSDTGVVLSNGIDADTAREVFDLLTISIAE